MPFLLRWLFNAYVITKIIKTLAKWLETLYYNMSIDAKFLVAYAFKSQNVSSISCDLRDLNTSNVWRLRPKTTSTKHYRFASFFNKAVTNRNSRLNSDWLVDCHFLLIIGIDIQIKINRWNDTKHQPHHFQWDFGNFSMRKMVKKKDDDKVIHFKFNKIFIESSLVLFK